MQLGAKVICKTMLQTRYCSITITAYLLWQFEVGPKLTGNLYASQSDRPRDELTDHK